MTIAIVGDPHISTGFRHRTDNYLQTVLRKLDDIAKQNDYVLMLGDVFDVSSMPTIVFNKTYKMMKHYPGKFHTIIGNHDLFHRNLKAIDKTTLGSLNLTEVLEVHTTPFTLDGVEFVPVLVDDDVNNIPVDESNSKVLVAHKYFEMFVSPEESFTADDLRRLNYKYVFLGHDHVPYEPAVYGESQLFRPGSLTRITTDLFNKDRGIRYYQLDTSTMDVEEMAVECEPSEQVFLKGSFDKKDTVVKKTDVASLSKLLARFDKRATSQLSLDTVLRQLKGTDEQIQYLKELHTMNNLKYT